LCSPFGSDRGLLALALLASRVKVGIGGAIGEEPRLAIEVHFEVGGIIAEEVDGVFLAELARESQIVGADSEILVLCRTPML